MMKHAHDVNRDVICVLLVQLVRNVLTGILRMLTSV